jgi:hypothetical protein
MMVIVCVSSSRVTQHASLMVLLLVAACAIPQTPFRTVYEDPVNFVRLETDPTVAIDIPQTWHSHPATIGPEVMAGILKGFNVQEHRTKLQRILGGEAPREPAFRDEEVALLAPKLADALSRADPKERVTYYLSRPQTSIKREITSGGLYVKDDQLHFILGNHRIIYGIPAYGMVYDRRYPMRPTAAKGFDLSFDPETAVVKRSGRLWDRLLGRDKDELVINLRKLPTARPVARTASVITMPPWTRLPQALAWAERGGKGAVWLGV